MQLRTTPLIPLILLAASAAAQTSLPAVPSQASGYSLMFSDDFVNLNLSPNGTGQYTWYPGFFWEKTPATPFHASVSSSVADLAWMQGQSLSDTTMSACSPQGTSCHAYRYGYFEARMKWDAALGSWPSFLLLPVQSIWGSPENGELDVFEGQHDGYNNTWYFGTIHDQVTSNGSTTDIQNNACCNYHAMPGVDFTQWHTYGVLWVPGKVTWYFDNVAVLSANTYPIYDQQNYFPVFNAQLGPNWTPGGTAGVTATSLNLYVDWIRIWQKL